MKKGIQKILLSIVVITVMSHSIFPHVHHHVISDISLLSHSSFSSSCNSTEFHNGDKSLHNIFSQVQLDETFVPQKNLNLSIKFFHNLIIQETNIYTPNYFVQIKKAYHSTINAFYFNKTYNSFSHRGPPLV